MKRLAAALALILGFSIFPLEATSALKVTPHNLNFGSQPVGTVKTESFLLTNETNLSVAIGINISAHDDLDVGLEGSTCSLFNQILAAAGSCTVAVRYHPIEAFLGASATATITVTATDLETNRTLASTSVHVRGRGRL